MRNYCKFWVIAGTEGGSPTTTFVSTEEEAFARIAQLDPGSLVYPVTQVWVGLDKRQLALLLNRWAGNEIYDPVNGGDVPPLIFLESPRGKGRFTTQFGDVIHFEH